MSAPLLGTMLFAALAVFILGLSALAMLSRNYVHSAVFLAGALIGFAGIFALLGATFIALLQVFVYAGAVSILVIFVIMMTRTSVPGWDQLLHRQRWAAPLVVGVFAVGVVRVIVAAARLMPAEPGPPRGTDALATHLFLTYAVPFELASLVLLGALIGAVYLAREAE
ncbi:MAG: NADH-quinone oxidoreductase subunit J [Actinobacteria bacterium]|nr:MAG: NADH-quinone oxidoreductase subunit J [Actinomycetota bacterium]